MKDQDKIIDNLIETLKDGQEGFTQAAESVKDPQLKAVFDEYSRQRGRFAVELRSKAQSADERESDMSGSAAGALHRGWINLKSALTRGDDHSILAECERGEDSAVEEFRKALNNGLSARVQEIVSRQYVQIKEAHDRVKNLRDTTKKS
ncbi:MAG: PA2169 family four-helix-bundle protein [Candidatus Udaeobacter sp.]